MTRERKTTARPVAPHRAARTHTSAETLLLERPILSMEPTGVLSKTIERPRYNRVWHDGQLFTLVDPPHAEDIEETLSLWMSEDFGLS